MASFLTWCFPLQKVAVELLIDNHSVPGSQGNCVLAVDCSPLPSSATNAERLKSGLEEYALKHGNRLQDICRLCFSTKSVLHFHLWHGWVHLLFMTKNEMNGILLIWWLYMKIIAILFYDFHVRISEASYLNCWTLLSDSCIVRVIISD